MNDAFGIITLTISDNNDQNGESQASCNRGIEKVLIRAGINKYQNGDGIDGAF